MPRFLNRLLALPIAEQNQLFAELEERIAANIEQAIEAGSYEVGVETVTADSLTIAGRETLYEHPGTGAATELVEIVRRDKLVPLTAEAALEIGERDPGPDGKPRLAVNTRSKRAAIVLPASSRMIDDGGVQERVRLIRPATGETMARAELDASNWRRADEAQWRPVWDAEIAGLPSHRESRFWLATGLLLPVWDRLPAENMRVRRLTSDDGIALIGRVLDAEQVRAVRAGFGLDGGPPMTGPEAFAAVMERGNALALANGWRLARRRLMGANRIEIEGPADTDLPALRRMGCAVEIVSFRARIFAPNAAAMRTHPRPLAARRVSQPRAIRIAGPPSSGAAGLSAAIPRAVARGGRGPPEAPPNDMLAPPPAGIHIAGRAAAARRRDAMTAQTLPDNPNFCFCPAYDVETDVQQIRIVIEGLAGHVPTALVTLDLDDALNICDKLNRRLGYDREAWTAMAAASMRAEDDDPESDPSH